MVLLKSPFLIKETSYFICNYARFLGQFDHNPLTVQRLRAFFGFANSALRRKTNERTDRRRRRDPANHPRSLARLNGTAN